MRAWAAARTRNGEEARFSRCCPSIKTEWVSGSLRYLNYKMKQNKRRDKDVSKLVLSAYQVQLINNKTSEFIVKFRGPPGSAY